MLLHISAHKFILSQSPQYLKYFLLDFYATWEVAGEAIIMTAAKVY